jgi:hypothetical protein
MRRAAARSRGAGRCVQVQDMRAFTNYCARGPCALLCIGALPERERVGTPASASRIRRVSPTGIAAAIACSTSSTFHAGHIRPFLDHLLFLLAMLKLRVGSAQ